MAIDFKPSPVQPPARRRPVYLALMACAMLLGSHLGASQAQTSAAAPAPSVPVAGQAQSLNALLTRMLPADPQVRVARALYQATEQRRLQARSRLGPTMGLSANHGQSKEVEFGRALDRRTERVELSLRWNLYNNGNDKAEFDGATRDVDAAGQDLRRAREEAAERIAIAYAELQRLDELLPRSAQRMDAVQGLAKQVQRQTELGKTSEADSQQAQASLLDAEIVHEQLLADRDGAALRLAALVGEPVTPALPVLLAAPATATALAAPTPGQVAAAQLRAEAAQLRVRPLWSVYTPRIDVEYSQPLSDRTNPSLTTERQRGWLLTAFCVMDTHVHLLIETPEPDLSAGIGRIQGRYARRFNKRHGSHGALFQQALLVAQDRLGRISRQGRRLRCSEPRQATDLRSSVGLELEQLPGDGGSRTAVRAARPEPTVRDARPGRGRGAPHIRRARRGGVGAHA